MIPAETPSSTTWPTKMEVPVGYRRELQDIVTSKSLQSLWDEIRLQWKRQNDPMRTNSDVISSIRQVNDQDGQSDESPNSDPALNPTRLPDSHPIYMLQKTKRFFRGRPAKDILFLLIKHLDKQRYVDTATKDSRLPECLTKAKIVV